MNPRHRALLARMVRYGLAGLLATATYFVAVLVLVELLAMAPVPAAVIATAIVAVTSYVVNRAFVFDTNRSHASAFSRYVAASILSVIVNAGLMRLATGVLAWPYLAGAALTVLVVPPMNFVVNYFWAFRATQDNG